MNWKWLTDFFTAPGKVVKLQKALEDTAILLIEARDNYDNCQFNKSKLFTDLTLAIAEKQALKRQITVFNETLSNMDSEIQALKDSQSTTDTEKDKTIAELKATALRRQGTIENLTKQRDELKARIANADDITPEKLTTSLIAKYSPGTDVAKIWDDYDLALIKFFAINNDESVKSEIIPVGNFVQALSKAFPNAVFQSEALDNLYYAPSMDFAEKAIRNDFGNLRPYVLEKSDCDDFAEDLRVHFRKVYGYNTGVIVLGDAPIGYHAWLLLVCYDGILEIEPQDDSISRIPDVIEGYVVRKFHTY